MLKQMSAIGASALTLWLIGCKASVDTRPASSTTEVQTINNAAPPPSRVRTEAETIRDYAIAIQNSRDRIEEAAAIRRFNEYLGDRNLTFNVTGVRAADDA